MAQLTGVGGPQGKMYMAPHTPEGFWGSRVLRDVRHLNTRREHKVEEQQEQAQEAALRIARQDCGRLTPCRAGRGEQSPELSGTAERDSGVFFPTSLVRRLEGTHSR